MGSGDSGPGLSGCDRVRHDARMQGRPDFRLYHGNALDVLAGLLAAEALEDALKGLEPDDITGPGGLLTQLAGRVIETALGAELTEHLGHPPGGVTQGPNVRNGAGRKTVKDTTIERRFRRYKDFAGLAFWLYLTRDWVTQSGT